MGSSGWCARSVRAVRERGWVVLWILVGTLLVVAFPGGDWVGADHGGTTDTTAVVGSGTDTRDHGGEQPPNCSHGSYTINPGTDNEQVKCRYCSRRTYAARNGVCRAVSRTPGCPPAHTIVSSWPNRCVPIYCPTFGNPPDNQDEWRNLATGNCIDKCPTGSSWSPTSKRCIRTTNRPTTTTTVRRSSSPNPWEETISCGAYGVHQEELWYLNMDDVARERPTERRIPDSDILGADGDGAYGPSLDPARDEQAIRARMERHVGNCPPFGQFDAGVRQQEIDDNETALGYRPVWIFEKRIYEPYGLITGEPKAKSDICSSSPDRGGSFDFRAMCQAHDYCADLVRFGVSPRVTKSGTPEEEGIEDCDTRFKQLMRADCETRPVTHKEPCYLFSGGYFRVVTLKLGDIFPSPGVVRIRSVTTGRCLSRSGVILGGLVTQATCNNASSQQRFRLVPTSDQYRLMAVGLPDFCVVVPGRGAAIRLGRCSGTQADVRFVNRSELDQYWIQLLGNDSVYLCWTPDSPPSTRVAGATCSGLGQSRAPQEWELVAEV